MAVRVDSTETFNNLSSKISNLVFGRTEEDRNILSKTLDDLNSLNYRYSVVTNPTKAILLVNQCCNFIPIDDLILVQKCSQLLWNLVNRQHIVVEGKTLIISVQWCLGSLKIGDKNVLVDVLQALDGLLRSNPDNIPMMINDVTKNITVLLNSTDKKDPETVLLALQCLEACTVVQNDSKIQNKPDCFKQFELCAKAFLKYLTEYPKNFDKYIHNKIFKVSLCGLQNVILQHSGYLRNELGTILGIIKTFMVHGLQGINFIEPQKLRPSTLSIPEVPNNVLREKKGGKLTKQRKHKSAVRTKDVKHKQEILFDSKSTGYVPAAGSLENNSDHGQSSCLGRLKTSDSDFSDGETSRVAKMNHVYSQVRRAALHLFCSVIKLTEKSTIFSYWCSFVPQGTALTEHNILTCILKDPSARGRMSALNVLLLLLTSCKMYLMQAESNDKTTSFTPFSVLLGFTLTELHKGLSLASNEMSVPVLTQVLKCFAALVQATPYHKMNPGLITKVARNVKIFVYYKDASVQVTALIVLGCILASEPILSETTEVMLKWQIKEKKLLKEKKIENNLIEGEEFNFAEFSESDEEETQNASSIPIPWLLERCLSNLGVCFDNVDVTDKIKSQIHLTGPAPVKLESLQVVAAMSRNYFEVLMAPHLSYIIKALEFSLVDKYADLRLHAGRTVDFIGQAINRSISEDKTGKKSTIRLENFLNFWQTLLNGPLVELLQCEQHAILRAVGCDCLGSIGSHIFEQLTRDKQILCVTLLFSCTRDEENGVKGAAVRALAICVLYPSLREDPGFVIDTAESIYRTLQDENLMVRVKASWSLGNLSDALVINKPPNADSEEIPESLILKLFESSIKGAFDNDKIKMNAVRAVGNLLQLINDKLIEKTSFGNIIEQAFDALVKNCTTGSNMKARWNACYALGNAMKNPVLYQHSRCKNWKSAVFNALTDLVVSFRNFKVRINAAVALSSPTKRDHYSQFFQLVWKSLLSALENSQNMEDFSEYKHRDHLVEQVCIALGHLTTLLQKDDLQLLLDTIQLYHEPFKFHTLKVLERLVPEKATTLASASYALTLMEKKTDLKTDEKYVLELLKEGFKPEF